MVGFERVLHAQQKPETQNSEHTFLTPSLRAKAKQSMVAKEWIASSLRSSQ